MQGRATVDAPWTKMCVGKDAKTIENSDKHIVHEVSELNIGIGIRFVRLVIHRPSTMWGSSVWRFQVWGYPVV